MSNFLPFRLWGYWRAYSTLQYTFLALQLRNAFVFKCKKNKRERSFRLTFFHVGPSTTNTMLPFGISIKQDLFRYSSRTHANTVTRSVSQSNLQLLFTIPGQTVTIILLNNLSTLWVLVRSCAIGGVCPSLCLAHSGNQN